MDWRALNLLCPNGTGDAPAGMPGLWAAGALKCPGKGKPIAAWLLEADDVGIGGEKGNAGYWAEGCLLGPEVGGEGGAGGSSSAKETPSARSLASCSSFT